MKDRCPCGGIILADTENWEEPLCHECWLPFAKIDIPKVLGCYNETIQKLLELIKELSQHPDALA